MGRFTRILLAAVPFAAAPMAQAGRIMGMTKSGDVALLSE